MSDVLALCYHAVSERWPAALSVTPAQLASQLSLLASRGYRGVTFSEAVADPTASRTVAITFDDGYRSVIALALPILREIGFVGTVFAPTGWVGRPEPMTWPGIDEWLTTDHRDELLPMSWEELEELAAAGWEIGSHTRSHPHLPDLDSGALEAELADSRAEIEGRLGNCRALAYPYGDYDARVMTAAGRAGYSAAGTLWRQAQASGSPLDYPRVGIYRVDGARRFKLKVSPILRTVRRRLYGGSRPSDAARCAVP